MTTVCQCFVKKLKYISLYLYKDDYDSAERRATRRVSFEDAVDSDARAGKAQDVSPPSKRQRK